MSIQKVTQTLACAAAAVCALLVTPAAALDEFQYTDTRTIDVGSEVEVLAKTLSGDIEYIGSDVTTATVHITIDVRAGDEDEADQIRDEIDVIVDGESGFLDAHVEYSDDFWRAMRRAFGKGRSVSVSFAIEGPRKARGELNTVSGQVHLANIDDDMEVGTVSGDVEVEDVSTRTRVETVSGNIDVQRASDPLHLVTVSGDITARGCGAAVYAHSVSGDIDLSDIALEVESSSVSGDIQVSSAGGGVSASTTSGRIEVEHESGDLELSSGSGDIRARSRTRDGDIYANTMSGDVRLFLGDDVGGDILLTTFSGRIDTERDIHARERSKRKIKGTLGKGDAFIDVKTFSGNITIAGF